MTTKNVLFILSVALLSLVFTACGEINPDPNTGADGGSGADTGAGADGTMTVTVCKVEMKFNTKEVDQDGHNVSFKNKNDQFVKIEFYDNSGSETKGFGSWMMTAGGGDNEFFPIKSGMKLQLDADKLMPPVTWQTCEHKEIVLP